MKPVKKIEDLDISPETIERIQSLRNNTRILDYLTNLRVEYGLNLNQLNELFVEKNPHLLPSEITVKEIENKNHDCDLTVGDILLYAESFDLEFSLKIGERKFKIGAKRD